jgi:hypothetical protein
MAHDISDYETQLLVMKLFKEINILKKELYILKKNVIVPYIKIKHFENIKFNFKDWKLTLNKLFFENYLPQMWIINKIQYIPKNKKQIIVYVFIISITVKHFIRRKLETYCNNQFINVQII